MKVIEFIRKNLKWFIVFICLILVIGILEDNTLRRSNFFNYTIINFVTNNKK